MPGFLHSIESWLQRVVEGRRTLAADVQPLDLVREIEREIERHRKVFVNDEVYVPHRLVIHLLAPTPGRVEEYEALFNTPQFREWVDGYISERGYQLLARLRIGVECHEAPPPDREARTCWVDFSWVADSADPADVTVVFDPRDHTRILSAEPGRSEVPVAATLEVIAGDAYASPIPLCRVTTHIGRGAHVMDASGRRVVRVNRLAFTRATEADSVNHSVSRRHARVVFREGGFYLVDDGSQNGTRVVRGGSTLLVPREATGIDPIKLQGDDVIEAGRARIRFHRTPDQEVAG